MSLIIELLLVFIVLTNLTLVGSSRLATCIRLTAVQGMAISLLPLLAEEYGFSLRLLLLAVVIFLVKGLVLPKMLTRTLRTADVYHEVEPLVGFTASVVLEVTLLAVSFWMASRLPLPRPAPSPLALPLAMSTILTGLFLIVSRRKALTQVLGYLVLENGVYVFGLVLAPEAPFLVEMGILLDVFVAVFVMGIAIFHIRREFDHIDVDQLTSLRD